MLQLQPEDAFGGMYTTSTAINVMKTILAFGTFIVVLQSRVWAEKSGKEGEILYVSCLYTFGYGGYDERRKLPYVLLGLRNGICSNGVRYCFRCLFATIRLKQQLNLYSQQLLERCMLYGISFLYGAYGTMYFTDIATNLQATPFTIMGLVFFFSGSWL